MSPPLRVPADSPLAKAAIARLRGGGSDPKGDKAFAVVAGLDQPGSDKQGKPNKFRNRLVKDVEGTFHSVKEHRRWKDLKLMARSGQIRKLVRQVKFDLVVNGVRLGAYVADHAYDERQGDQWVPVVEDVKSAATEALEAYRLKRGLMLAVHNITIREV